jgi:glycosyltransferase involved in cell wall biosynthesis
VSVHGLDVFADRQAGRWLGPWTKRSSLRVYSRADAIVCISEKVRQLLPEICRAKARVIYNGVDSSVFTPAREPEGFPRILSVGNLIPTKDHALLLRAFARVLQHVPDSQLEIIGDGPERSRLPALANSLGIASSVTLRGRQDRGAVAAAMQKCTVFALPSRYEGLGCVYLEAMACGKPAIGCKGQGIDEIIEDGENGMLIRPGDEAELSEALLVLLRDEASRRRLGFAARETVLQKHTLQHQAASLAEVYRECAQ